MSSSRPSQASTSGRTTAVLAATFATTGEGLRCTITFAPSASTTGSAQVTPNPAATVTAARTAPCTVGLGEVLVAGGTTPV